MNVREIMSRQVRTCRREDSLNAAAQLMWENDCGSLPVVDEGGKAVAMLTDRDICMAAYTQGQPLESISVASAASREIFTVRENQPVDDAEALMREHQVRRVPVVDESGKLTGIVSMNDLARHAHNGHHPRNGLSSDAVVQTLAAVCRPMAGQPQAAE
jgi:CBS domain-containing protein